MDREAVSAARLTLVALLVAVAAFGCANRGAAQPAGQAPAAQGQATQSSRVEEAASTPTPTPIDTAATNPAGDPEAADDSLGSDLSDLDRLLSGINSALSGSEPAPSGGE